MAEAIASGKRPDSDNRDAFTRFAHGLASWIKKNPRSISVGLVGVALIVAGLLYYRSFQQTLRETAISELMILSSMDLEPADFATDLEAYVDRFDGTPEADQARVQLGVTLLAQGRSVEAVDAVEGVGTPVTDPIGFSARGVLAAALEAAGDAQAALQVYQELSLTARFPFQRREARASMARIEASLGNYGAAVAIYQEIAEEAEADEDPVEAGVYRLRLGEVEGLRAMDTAPVPSEN